MGLAKPALRFIAREHRRKPFTGPILTLGRQDVFATLDEARSLLASEGIPPAVLSPGEGTRTNIPGRFDTTQEKNTSDVAFFKLLGVSDVLALDYSAFESAEIVHDLNLPVPDEWHDRFGLILDGGTLEHVFDVRQSLMNVAMMLKAGGRVIHFSPASNWVNHGFYQFSPTLFYDYYAANGFRELRGLLAEHDVDLVGSPPWDFFEVGTTGRFASQRGLMTVFVAEKSIESTADKVPVQSHYTELYQQAERGGAGWSISRMGMLLRCVKAMRPDGLRLLARRLVPGYDRRRELGKLKRWDRFS